MPNIPNFWKTDLVPFVGKAFDTEIAARKRMKALMSLVSEITTKSATYEIRGTGDSPTLPKYDGSINFITPKRGFNRILQPAEVLGAENIHYKQWLNDMSGEAKRAGTRLGSAAFSTIFISLLDVFGNAFNSAYAGADGKPWAASDHPNASKGTKTGSREYEADTESGTFSNLFALALTSANIDKMRADGYRYVTPAGVPYLGEYDLLLVSPELEGKARQLLGTQSKYMPTKNPDSDTNAASSITDMKGYVVVGGGTKGLGAAQWALADSAKLPQTLALVYNTKPEVSEAVNTNKYIRTFMAYADYDIGFSDARSILFSSGV